MGKVTLNKKFKTYTGKLPPNGHRFYLTNRFGQEIISHMPEHRDPDAVTDAQRHAFQLIKEASTKADADLREDIAGFIWIGFNFSADAGHVDAQNLVVHARGGSP